MGLIPKSIQLPIIHSGDNAQITGFEELFVLLNTNPNAEDLRRLVVSYFNKYPDLQGHLSERSFRFHE